MKTVFIGNIAPQTTEKELRALVEPFGTIRKLEMPRDIFSGNCKGFALIDMEGHEARALLAGLSGKTFMDNLLKVTDDKPKAKGRGRR
jgi:RNA recognition motif-containing protein